MPRATPIKRKRAIKALITGESNTITDAMLRAGYTPSSAAHNQHLITRSKEYKELADYGITIESVARRHKELLDSKEETIAIKAVDIGYKVSGLYDQHTTRNTFNAPVMIQITPPEAPHTALQSDIIESK
jgi:hypothetical protein